MKKEMEVRNEKGQFVKNHKCLRRKKYCQLCGAELKGYISKRKRFCNARHRALFHKKFKIKPIVTLEEGVLENECE